MLKRFGAAVAAVLAVGLLASCVINTSDDSGSDDHGIDYKDHGSDWSIMVTNETQQKLVLFYGAPSSNKIIGGVKAGAKNQHMAKNAAVFGNSSSDFVLYAVKEKDYVANKSKLELLDDAPFTRLYAYYNVDGDNGTVYTISSVLGGNCYIVVNNDSPYNVELRLDGVNGQSLAYCGKGMYNQKFYWAEGEDYLVFPIFRKFSKTYGEIISIAPSKSNGKPVYETFSLVDQEGYRQYEFQASKWKTGQDFSFAPSAAYLKVVNLSSKGVALYPGANSTSVKVSDKGEATSSTGAKYITTNANNNFLVFTFNLKQIGGTKSDPKFEEQVTFANFQVGTSVEKVTVLDGKDLTIPAGHMLTLNVYDDDDAGFRTALATKAGTDEILDYEVNFDEIDDVSVR